MNVLPLQRYGEPDFSRYALLVSQTSFSCGFKHHRIAKRGARLSISDTTNI
jgi:hypothetical protein